MVLRWYEYRCIRKQVVLYIGSIGMKLVWFYKGVLQLIDHPYCFIKDKYCCLSSLWIVICCGCFHNWNTSDNLIYICVCRHITPFTYVVHDYATVSIYISVGFRVQYYLNMYNGTYALLWDLPTSFTKATDIAPLSRVYWGYPPLIFSASRCAPLWNWKIKI